MSACVTIFEKGKKVKIYPLFNKVQIFSDDLEVLFDFKTKNITKKEISTKKNLEISQSEELFYQKIFFKYLFQTKSWEPQSFNESIDLYKLPKYKAFSR